MIITNLKVDRIDNSSNPISEYRIKSPSEVKNCYIMVRDCVLYKEHIIKGYNYIKGKKVDSYA